MTFQIQQEKFEGPLELLLDFIEKEKLAISEISLAKVTDGYLAYVRSLHRPDPEELAEFLVVAAQLILIKSRSLLPELRLSDEEETSIDELEQRLKELARIREAAKEMRYLEKRGLRIVSRDGYLGMEPVFYPSQRLSIRTLFRALAAFAAALPKIEKLAEEKLKRIVSLEEKISHIRVILRDALERGFSEIVRGSKEKIQVIISFLAILELAKQKWIELRQEKLFEDIAIRKRANGA